MVSYDEIIYAAYLVDMGAIVDYSLTVSCEIPAVEILRAPPHLRLYDYLQYCVL